MNWRPYIGIDAGMRGLARASVLVVTPAIWFLASCGTNSGFSYSGTLQAESAQVGSTIGGRVVAVLVSDGQRVKNGQVLVRFDDSNEQAALAAAVSQEAQAAAALADLEAGPRAEEISRALAAEDQAKAVLDKARFSKPQELQVAHENVHQAEAALAQAQATAAQASRNFARVQRLFSQGAVAAQTLDDARAARNSALAGVSAAQARLASTQAQLVQTERASVPQDIALAQRAYDAAVASRQLVQAGPRAQQIAQARAALNAAKANVAAAESRLREMIVKSPADGIVESLDLRPGDLVGPRVQVASIHEFLDPYVRIYVAQRDLGRVALGQRVRVRSDALNGEVFDGSVEQVDQDAQFTPRDVQTAEDRANLTYGVKVRVHDPTRRLRGGTTVEVAVE